MQRVYYFIIFWNLFESVRTIGYNRSKLKVAICYWGMTRSTRAIFQTHHHFLFHTFDIADIAYDVYFHTWRTKKNLIWGSAIATPINYDEYKLLCPDFYQIDSQDKFLKTINLNKYYDQGAPSIDYWNPDVDKNHICSLESQRRVAQMVKNSRIIYDYVLFIRPDIRIGNHFPINAIKLIQPNQLGITNRQILSGIKNLTKNKIITPSDDFAIIPFRNGNYLQYGQRLKELLSFRQQHKVILISEGYLQHIARKYFNKIHYIEFWFDKIRPNNLNYDESEGLRYLNKSLEWNKNSTTCRTYLYNNSKKHLDNMIIEAGSECKTLKDTYNIKIGYSFGTLPRGNETVKWKKLNCGMVLRMMEHT